jgi:hypothetical protein
MISNGMAEEKKNYCSQSFPRKNKPIKKRSETTFYNNNLLCEKKKCENFTSRHRLVLFMEG